MFFGAFIPGIVLVLLYMAYILISLLRLNTRPRPIRRQAE